MSNSGKSCKGKEEIKSGCMSTSAFLDTCGKPYESPPGFQHYEINEPCYHYNMLFSGGKEMTECTRKQLSETEDAMPDLRKYRDLEPVMPEDEKEILVMSGLKKYEDLMDEEEKAERETALRNRSCRETNAELKSVLKRCRKSVSCEKTDYKDEDVKCKANRFMICYVNTGMLPKSEIKDYLEYAKTNWGKPLCDAADCEVVFLPCSGDTRTETVYL